MKKATSMNWSDVDGVKVRVSGSEQAIKTVVQRLFKLQGEENSLFVANVSGFYPNRNRNDDSGRVYLDLIVNNGWEG